MNCPSYSWKPFSEKKNPGSAYSCFLTYEKGVCQSQLPTVLSPSSTRLSIGYDLQKNRSIPRWLEVGFLLLMGTH